GTQTLLVYHWLEGSRGLAVETARALAAVDSSPLRLPGEILVVRLVTDLETPIATGLGPAEARLAAFYLRLRPVLDALQRAGSEDPRKSISGISLEGKFFSGALGSTALENSAKSGA